MIYIYDFVVFLFEQFDYIFSLIASFFDIIDYFFDSGYFFTGLPTWLVAGLSIPLVLSAVFRITQLIPTIGGFDS